MIPTRILVITITNVLIHGDRSARSIMSSAILVIWPWEQLTVPFCTNGDKYKVLLPTFINKTASVCEITLWQWSPMRGCSVENRGGIFAGIKPFLV